MKIEVPFTNLKHIIHLADIHVRLFRRHDEYELVFNRLYDDIRRHNLEDFVIVLAGDIVHAKTDMSPEMIEVTSRFLKNISDIAPTILIAGNHDCNLANLNRLDSLTPIVNSLAHPNLYYAKDSDVIAVADTEFAVFSIFDEPENWPSVTELTANNKIALYHGPVHGAATDTGFVITSEKVTVSTFDGFDMVLLGDIHKFQCLQQYDSENKKPIIQYAGSTIQQNQGETLHGHGWALWDVEGRSVTLNEVNNDFGYVTVDVVDGHYNIPTAMPKNVRMRMFTNELDAVETNKLISLLKSKHNIIELSVNKSRTKKSIVRTSNIKLKELSDLTNVNTQNELISEWIQRNDETVTPDVLNSISQINFELNTKITHDDQSRNIHWKPIKFTFSNMFSYGEQNQVHFENMKGIYGLFAPNASGKSSLMDALMFCLYDKTPRAFKGDHIINNRKDTFECELIFDINGDMYGIKRVGNRKKSGDVKVDVNFWKVENGVTISLNAEDRRTTNSIIRNFVGSYEDFAMTTMSGQLGNSLFIDKSHSERKDLLNQFMGLNVFDNLHELANTELKETSAILKRFKKLEITDEISNTILHINEKKEELLLINSEIDLLYLEKDALEKEVLISQQKKIPTPTVSKSKNELTRSLTSEQQLLKKAEEDISVFINTQEQLQYEIESLENDLLKYDVQLLETSVKNHALFKNLLTEEGMNLRHVKSKIDSVLTLQKKLQSYEYNSSCNICVKNNKSVIDELNNVRSELDKLYANKLLLESNIEDLVAKIDKLKDDTDDYSTVTSLISTIKHKKHEFEKHKLLTEKSKISHDRILINISSIKSEIELYEGNETAILYNQKIHDHIQDIIKQVDDVKRQILLKEHSIRNFTGELKVLEEKQKELIAQIKEATELEIKHRAYSLYMKAISRDGIPYEIIGKTIPMIEDEINNILSQIVNFRVSLEVDGKNINSILSYDDDRTWPLENSSGMERFISSLAIRVALVNASNLPKPNFMVIDEGFGVLDVDNLHSMQTLFNILKSHFDFIFIVSHLDKMRDMVDTLLEIKKEDGYSHISV